MALLKDSEGAQLQIELRVLRWLDGAGKGSDWTEKKGRLRSSNRGKASVGLDSAVSGLIAIHVGNKRVAKPNCSFSLEELVDLVRHVEKLLGERIEDEFEWSTLEKSAQPLRVYRQGSASLHVELTIGLGGFPEDYDGAASLGMQFDTSAANLRAFGRAIESELRNLLKGTGVTMSALRRELEAKVTRIRQTGRNPYPSLPG